MLNFIMVSFHSALDQFGDTILFTTDDDILEAMAQYDDTFGSEMEMGGPGVEEEELQRPRTADGEGEERPFTQAGFRKEDTHTAYVMLLLKHSYCRYFGLNIKVRYFLLN